MSTEDGFDSLLTTIGLGKWQLPMLILPMTAMYLSSVNLLGSSFLTPPVPFRCFSGQEAFWNSSKSKAEGFWNNTFDSSVVNETYFDSLCLSEQKYATQDVDGEPVLTGSQKRTSLASCPIIEYDTSIFSSTITFEFDLVCERSSLKPFFISTYTLGNILGCFLGGHIGDRWGRKLVSQIGSVISIVSFEVMLLVPNYPVILITRFIAGCFVVVTLVPSWSLAVEITPCKYRSLIGMLLALPYSLAIISTSGLAYHFRSWRLLFFIAVSPSLLIIISCALASESVRWLLLQGKTAEARKILERALKLHHIKELLPIEAVIAEFKEKKQVSTKTHEDQSSFWDPVVHIIKDGLRYLRSNAMRNIFVSLTVIWILNYGLFVTVALNSSEFSSNDIFLYVALSGAIDSIGVIAVTPLSYLFGRVSLLLVAYIGSGVLFYMNIIIPASYYGLKWVIVMSGFLLVSFGLQVNYILAPEVFPTSIRARGFAFVEVMGSVGESLAPFVTDFLSQYGRWLTGLSFGSAALMAGLLVSLLPETKDLPLPETLEDVEERQKSKKKKLQRATVAVVENISYPHQTSLEGVENHAYVAHI